MLAQLEGDEKQKVTRIMVASIIVGVAVAIAPSMTAWLSGVDINNIQTTKETISSSSSGGLPPAFANVLHNGYMVITILGAVIAAGGLILGAVKM